VKTNNNLGLHPLELPSSPIAPSTYCRCHQGKFKECLQCFDIDDSHPFGSLNNRAVHCATLKLSCRALSNSLSLLVASQSSNLQPPTIDTLPWSYNRIASKIHLALVGSVKAVNCLRTSVLVFPDFPQSILCHIQHPSLLNNNIRPVH
jgi:hypothetical protein